MDMRAADNSLFFFGYGYTAAHLSHYLQKSGQKWAFSGTTTDAGKLAAMKASGMDAYLFDGQHPLCKPEDSLKDVTHVLLSVPPEGEGDIVFDMHGDDIAALPHLKWIGYLSTTGVYGDHGGAIVTEDTPCQPDTRRGDLRVVAEQQWLGLAQLYNLPLHIFRLSGIYGQGRSAIDTVRAGTAQRIDKPGHAFNRIHVQDIAQVLAASMASPAPFNIYNLADDCPAPSHEVVSYACALTGMQEPPLKPYQECELAPMVRSFYKDNKRVDNAKIKRDLGVTLLYPDYKSGLRACLEGLGQPDSPPTHHAARA